MRKTSPAPPRPVKPAFLGAPQKLASFFSTSDWGKASLLLKNWSFLPDDAFMAAELALSADRDDLVVLAFQSTAPIEHTRLASQLLDGILPRTYTLSLAPISPSTQRVLTFLAPLLAPEDLAKCLNVGAQAIVKIIIPEMTYKTITKAICFSNSAPDLSVFDDVRMILPPTAATDPSLLRTLFALKHHDWFTRIIEANPKRCFQYAVRHKLPVQLLDKLIEIMPNSCASELVTFTPSIKTKWPSLAAKSSAWNLSQRLTEELTPPTVSKQIKRM